MTTIKPDPGPTTSPPLEPSVGSVLADTPAILVKDLERTPRERRRPYIALHLKLLFVVGIGFAWAGFSLWLSLSWIDALGQSITMPLAIAVIFGIAIIPGYLNANLIASLLIDRPPPLRFDLSFPEATVVIACFNEEETIEETLDFVVAQDYPGRLRILVADDGSTDRTAELGRARGAANPDIAVLTLPHGGKAQALTAALQQVRTPLMATVDADTLLMPSALRRVVARLLISPSDTVAVAGAVFVRNSRQNFITRAQEWDYFLGIASVKRQQGLFQGTMVAQGAFSVYRTAALRQVGGWPDRIGEDAQGGQGRLRAHRDRLHQCPRRRPGIRPATTALGARDDRGAARARRRIAGWRSVKHPRGARQLRLPLRGRRLLDRLPDRDRPGPLRQLRDRRTDDARRVAVERDALDDHVPSEQAVL